MHKITLKNPASDLCLPLPSNIDDLGCDFRGVNP
jgi:hypothetical protein